jgi:hypothetical protein
VRFRAGAASALTVLAALKGMLLLPIVVFTYIRTMHADGNPCRASFECGIIPDRRIRFYLTHLSNSNFQQFFSQEYQWSNQ